MTTVRFKETQQENNFPHGTNLLVGTFLNPQLKRKHAILWKQKGKPSEIENFSISKRASKSFFEMAKMVNIEF